MHRSGLAFSAARDASRDAVPGTVRAPRALPEVSMQESAMYLAPSSAYRPILAGRPDVRVETALAVANDESTRAILFGTGQQPKADAPTPVLVIEDDYDLRESMVAVLEACGYPALGAANGRDALAVLHKG